MNHNSGFIRSDNLIFDEKPLRVSIGCLDEGTILNSIVFMILPYIATSWELY